MPYLLLLYSLFAFLNTDPQEITCEQINTDIKSQGAEKTCHSYYQSLRTLKWAGELTDICWKNTETSGKKLMGGQLACLLGENSVNALLYAQNFSELYQKLKVKAYANSDYFDRLSASIQDGYERSTHDSKPSLTFDSFAGLINALIDYYLKNFQTSTTDDDLEKLITLRNYWQNSDKAITEINNILNIYPNKQSASYTNLLGIYNEAVTQNSKPLEGDSFPKEQSNNQDPPSDETEQKFKDFAKNMSNLQSTIDDIQKVAEENKNNINALKDQEKIATKPGGDQSIPFLIYFLLFVSTISTLAMLYFLLKQEEVIENIKERSKTLSTTALDTKQTIDNIQKTFIGKNKFNEFMNIIIDFFNQSDKKLDIISQKVEQKTDLTQLTEAAKRDPDLSAVNKQLEKLPELLAQDVAHTFDEKAQTMVNMVVKELLLNELKMTYTRDIQDVLESEEDRLTQQLVRLCYNLGKTLPYEETLQKSFFQSERQLVEVDTALKRFRSIKDFEKGEFGKTPPDKVPQRLRQFYHLAIAIRNPGYRNSLLEFSPVEWLKTSFLNFADDFFRAYQKAQRDGTQKAYNPAKSIIVEMTAKIDYLPIEIVLNQTLFDPKYHQGQNSVSNPDAPEDAIVGVIKNGWQNARGEIYSKSLVSVNASAKRLGYQA